jgi:chromosome partitioning protein
VNDLGRAAILASDVVLIPVQPSPYDVWASADTVQLIREAQQFKENIKAVFVINRKIVNTAIGRDVANALEQFDFPVLTNALCQRVIYAESAAQGRAVIETDAKSEAAIEMAQLANELQLTKASSKTKKERKAA